MCRSAIGPTLKDATRRVSVLVQHLAVAGEAIAPSCSLLEIELGDTAAAWRAAGFAVTAAGDCWCVHLGGVKIVLNEKGGGLWRMTVGSQLASAKTQQLESVQLAALPDYPQSTDSPSQHPNSCLGLGEVVLYAPHLGRFVEAMAACGISLKKPPKPMGDDHCVARYMLKCGASGQQLRLLVVGAKDPAATIDSNSSFWMVPAETEGVHLTGWLPLVRDLQQLTYNVPEIGSVKPAVQKGRQIATLKAKAIAGLTGTFAFLSDNGEPLFG